MVAQGAIAIALLWYGRKVLRILEAAREPEPQRWATTPSPAAARFETPHIEEQREPRIGFGRRIAQWLQEPMTSSGSNPWRKLTRWLQAPVGS